jgi:hypothetical protein
MISFSAKQQTMTILHTLHDGSIVRLMSAKELIRIPVWQGNRILDTAHVESIQRAIGADIQRLDFGYRIVSYIDNDATGRPLRVYALIDGQHRAAVLRSAMESELCMPDFQVVVLEKAVNCEYDIIACFNALNNSKPILWTDTTLVVNKYIAELELAFNKPKLAYIRKGTTCRPYLSCEKLRAALSAYKDLDADEKAIKEFVSNVKTWNTTACATAYTSAAFANEKEYTMLKKCADTGFMLAYDPKLPWIQTCMR